jgi:hypothetical protein
MKFYTRLLSITFLFFIANNQSEAQIVKYLPKPYISNATQYALTNFSSDAFLYAIASAYGLDSTGKAYVWQYLFYSANYDTGYAVTGTVINPLGFIPVGIRMPSLPGTLLHPIGSSFCESDLAISAAENGGGRQFRQQHPATRISATVNKFPLVPDTSRAYWTYLYTDTLGTQFQIFEVDGTTCQLIVIGIKGISSEVPEGIELYQNYPNPFNPVTKIRFTVSRTGPVSLKVFDVLGNQIEEPVHRILSAGIYETEFDGSKYSSGLYFYKLESNRITQTKKMLLIR